jgi:thioredoxin-dependent peroxiredoxin
MRKLLLVSAMSIALAGGVAAQNPPTVELKVGDTAPEFSLPGTDGKIHKLSAYKGKTVVVAWYPAAFTGGCTEECKQFTQSAPAIQAFDVAYFMASVDTPEKNLDFAKQEQANFPLLSDPQKTVAQAYGVLNARGVASRWTYFIGPDGKILYIEKKVNPTTAGADLAAKLAELKVRKK